MKDVELDIAYTIRGAEIVADLYEVLDAAGKEGLAQATNVSNMASKIERYLAEVPASPQKQVWSVGVLMVRLLHADLVCSAIARSAAGDIMAARERQETLCVELLAKLSKLPRRGKECDKFLNDATIEGHRRVNADRLMLLLRSMPWPSNYWREQPSKRFPGADETEQPTTQSESEETASGPLRLIAFLDDTPFASPQLLRPKLSYSLKFKVSGLAWPASAEKLRLDLVSTCPSRDYSVSEFICEKPKERLEGRYEKELSGNIQFAVPQSLLSLPHSFVARCAFGSLDGRWNEVTVIGHNQFAFRVVDEARDGIMNGYKRLDAHMVGLLQKLLETNPSVRTELPELLPVLDALTSILGSYSQGAWFKDAASISELEFQRNVLKDMRLKLGQDVQEHSGQAGGFTDIRYRGVIIELKVEKDNGDRGHICEQYKEQPTQYQGVEARQVGVALVLDVTPKEKPPGDIRNDILLVDVPTHGERDGKSEYPSKVLVFVVNGNLSNPSDYSR